MPQELASRGLCSARGLLEGIAMDQVKRSLPARFGEEILREIEQMV
jgi:hypothetical protein